MATRLFLRNDLLPTRDEPTSGEKSTALPVGTAGSTTPNDYHMSPVKGSSEVNQVTATLAQNTQQSSNPYRWTSNRLPTVTISANTWTFFFGSLESNAAANIFVSLSVYVWDKSTETVRGYIYDSSTQLGTEWGTTKSAQSFTFSGSSVSATAGDLLVCEVWHNAIQGMSTSYNGTFYWDGTDDTTTGTGNTSVASYLETPQDINLILPKSRITFIM